MRFLFHSSFANSNVIWYSIIPRDVEKNAKCCDKMSKKPEIVFVMKNKNAATKCQKRSENIFVMKNNVK